MKLLIAERQAYTAAEIAAAAARLGLTFIAVHSATRAREMIARRPPDMAVVSPKLLDGESGYTLATELQASGIAVALVSGSPCPQEWTGLFFSKPFAATDVLRALIAAAHAQREKEVPRC